MSRRGPYMAAQYTNEHTIIHTHTMHIHKSRTTSIYTSFILGAAGVTEERRFKKEPKYIH